MSGLIPIVLLGALILTLGGRLLVQRVREDRTHTFTIEEYSEARGALDSVFIETSAIKRIFAREDMELISRSATLDVQRFFLKERKTLAIQWLRMTQKRVTHLMNIHTRLAGCANEPSPTLEFKLAVDYLSFMAASNVLLVLLWCRGPFDAVRLVGYTVRAAQYFCFVFSLRLEKTDPLRVGSARQARLV